jgi:hypothetical protein
VATKRKKPLHKYPTFRQTKSGKIKKSYESPLTKKGKLKRKFLPAMYFDTSILIDYIRYDGVEVDRKDEFDTSGEEYDNSEHSTEKAFRDAVAPNLKNEKIALIRKKILQIDNELMITPVTSSLTHLEIIETHAGDVYRELASDSLGTAYIKGRGQKEIGDNVKKIFDKYIDYRATPRKSGSTTGIEMLAKNLCLVPSYVDAHGLDGIYSVDLVQFDLFLSDVWSIFHLLAVFQVGLADIMHLAVAKHFGCEYFASVDSDFKRVKKIVEKNLGIEILVSADQVLQVL